MALRPNLLVTVYRNTLYIISPEAAVLTMDLTSTKVVVLVLLGLIKLGSGLLPLVLTKILKKRSDRFLKKFIGASEACLDV